MNKNDVELQRTVGRPFVSGDNRINRTGRPKTFDELRRTADMIASELVPGPAGELISRGELLLRGWIKSRNPILQRAFIEYWVGKVPDRIEAEGLQPQTRLILHYAHELDAIEVDAVRALPSESGDGNSRCLKGPSD